MAVITVEPLKDSFSKIAEAHSSAEVDKWWLAVPKWARYAKIHFSVETLGATSLQLSLVEVPPFDRDDDHVIALREAAAFAAITAADVTSVVDIGPGVTGIADDVTGAAAADSYASINCILPDVLGIIITGAGVGANTYDLSVVFKP
jgi:hypothetical protein